MITHLQSVSWRNTAHCSHLFLTTAKYVKKEYNSLCKPRIGGCSGGGSGNENLTMYSRGFCSNSVGPWSSSLFWTLLRFFSCFLVRASFCFFSYKEENFNWKLYKKENPYTLDNLRVAQQNICSKIPVVSDMTQCHIPEDQNPQLHHCENLKKLLCYCYLNSVNTSTVQKTDPTACHLHCLLYTALCTITQHSSFYLAF